MGLEVCCTSQDFTRFKYDELNCIARYVNCDLGLGVKK
jgi:hypothetical protein